MQAHSAALSLAKTLRPSTARRLVTLYIHIIISASTPFQIINIHYRKWGFVDVTYRSSFQFTKVGFNFSKRIKALVMRKLAFPSELALKRKYSVKYVRRNDDDIIMI